MTPPDLEKPEQRPGRVIRARKIPKGEYIVKHPSSMQTAALPARPLPCALTLMLTFALPACAAMAQAQTSAQATNTLAPIQVQTTAESSLTAPSLNQAQERMRQIPGGAALVAESAWRASQAATIKDVLDYTPGVFAQPKWGEDARLSIRGSGLSRYYHTRGIALYQDGVPLNNADGSSDLQWVDPSAYHYTEVYKGANALRYGAGTLGGAVNFVTRTGHSADQFQGRIDLGSFGWRRTQLSSGFAGERLDGFVTGSWQRQDGFREHSGGNSVRVSGNLGLRLSNGPKTAFN